MDGDAAHGENRERGVEVGAADGGEVGAVDRVGGSRAERLRVEAERPLADLLVGRERDADLAVRGGVRREQRGGRGDDDRKAGLVVGAEERGAVGDDERPADETLELRRRGGVQTPPRRPEREDAAPVANDARPHAGAGGLGGGVEMGDEPERGLVLAPGRGGNGRVDVAVGRAAHVPRAERTELVRDRVGEHELSGRGGVVPGLRGGLRVERDVAQEAVEGSRHWTRRRFGRKAARRARAAQGKPKSQSPKRA